MIVDNNRLTILIMSKMISNKVACKLHFWNSYDQMKLLFKFLLFLKRIRSLVNKRTWNKVKNIAQARSTSSKLSLNKSNANTQKHSINFFFCFFLSTLHPSERENSWQWWTFFYLSIEMTTCATTSFTPQSSISANVTKWN